MTHRHARGATVAAGLLTLPVLFAISMAAPAGAEEAPSVTYEVVELDPLPDGQATSVAINNRGMIAGYTANVPDENTMHATVWHNGVALDLGTLGGPNSAVRWPGINDRGVVVGIAETGDLDPNQESWSCSAFFLVVNEFACLGFIWDGHEMRPLHPFDGGTHSFATAVNNRDQVVGWAEVGEPDPTCNAPQQLGFRAALWDTRRDTMHELPPLGDDSASAATAINDRGQVVGISGDCANAVGGFSARHAVMWDKGEVIEIGDLGGEAWNTPMAINQRGTVVGFANQEEAVGAEFIDAAFVWTRQDGVRALDLLDGDGRGQALGINDRDQIVGVSIGPGGLSAVIWQRSEADPGDEGVAYEVTDLNALAPGYDGRLLFAADVNNSGVITGAAVNAAGQRVAFVATPTG